MTKLSELINAGDGSLIRYRDGICWKAGGTWHAMKWRGDNEEYGAISVWRCLAFRPEEMKLSEVKIIDLLPRNPDPFAEGPF